MQQLAPQLNSILCWRRSWNQEELKEFKNKPTSWNNFKSSPDYAKNVEYSGETISDKHANFLVTQGAHREIDITYISWIQWSPFYWLQCCGTLQKKYGIQFSLCFIFLTSKSMNDYCCFGLKKNNYSSVMTFYQVEPNLTISSFHSDQLEKGLNPNPKGNESTAPLVWKGWKNINSSRQRM